LKNTRFGDLIWRLGIVLLVGILFRLNSQNSQRISVLLQREAEIYKDLNALAEATKQNTEAINHLSAVGEIHTQAIKQLVKDDIFSGKARVRLTTSYPDLPGMRITTAESK
jgi:hypothetical protein